MSLQAQRAVNISQLEPWLRHLALALAFYEDDKSGGTIRPGIRTVAQALGYTERHVYRGLKALVARRILIPTAWHHRTRCYRLDRLRLATYQPKETAYRCAVSRQPSRPASTPDMGLTPDLDVRGGEGGVRNLAPDLGVNRPLTWGSISAPPVLISDLNGDLNKNLRQCAPVEESPPVLEPGADAPVVPQPEPKERREEPNEEAPTDEPEPDPVFQSTPAFAVYRHLAADALQRACLERDDSPSNVAEHLKQLCAKQSLPYNVEIVRQAVDAAIYLRQKQAEAAWTSMKHAIRRTPPAPLSHPRRSRELARTG